MTQNNDTRSRAAMSQIESVAASLPSMKRKLAIWAVRSIISVAIAYGVVELNGPGWLIPVAWIYVAASLVIGVAMTLYAQKLVGRSQERDLSARDGAQE